MRPKEGTRALFREYIRRHRAEHGQINEAFANALRDARRAIRAEAGALEQSRQLELLGIVGWKP